MALKIDRAGLLTAAAACAVLLLTSCTCKIKEEQQAMINQLRTDSKQYTEDMKKAEADKSKILAELNARQGEVRQCNEKKAFVQDKMNKWPNIWPDWDPNAPAPAPVPPVQESPVKKHK